MKKVGWITTVAAVATSIAATRLLVASIPDIQRYLRMRSM
jgi:hypothetical protein